MNIRDILIRQKTTTIWVVLEQSERDRAYYIVGQQGYCPGGLIYVNNIGAIMVELESGWVRCHSEGWVTHDRRHAYVCFRDWKRKNKKGDTVTVSDHVDVQLRKRGDSRYE